MKRISLDSEIIIPTEAQLVSREYDLLMRNLGYYKVLNQLKGWVYVKKEHKYVKNLNIVEINLTFKGIKRR